MTWPFSDPDCRITDDFNGHSTGRHHHNAWDVGAEYGSAIYAPEPGMLLLHYAVRSKAGEVVLIQEPMASYPFNWYWADRYGACTILLGRTHWWLFAHTQLYDLFSRAFFKHVSMGPTKWRNLMNAEEFWELYHNWRDTFAVAEGERIGLIGDSGYSTGPHTHFEVYPVGGGLRDDRIDPATIWPEEYDERLA